VRKLEFTLAASARLRVSKSFDLRAPRGCRNSCLTNPHHSGVTSVGGNATFAESATNPARPTFTPIAINRPATEAQHPL
jgi:hypothetical protein